MSRKTRATVLQYSLDKQAIAEGYARSTGAKPPPRRAYLPEPAATKGAQALSNALHSYQLPGMVLRLAAYLAWYAIEAELRLVTSEKPPKEELKEMAKASVKKPKAPKGAGAKKMAGKLGISTTARNASSKKLGY